ncbi:hypothetical protein G9A89_023433 [Geosiphon pyriformis]|nr:hypothetical protein G9A89_023433 [Geosiphon pyriformis]
MLKPQTSNTIGLALCIWLTLRRLNRQFPEILGNTNNTLSNVYEISSPKYSPRWSLEESKALLEAYKVFGSKWKLISQNHFPLRTAKSLECKWYDLKANGEIINQKHTQNSKKWTPEEDKELYIAVIPYSLNKRVDWKAILLNARFPGKNTLQLSKRYHGVLAQPKRGPWTKQEDEKLLSLVQSHGNKWIKISHHLQRPTCSIRLRYSNYLAPGIKRSQWTDEEFHQLAKAFQDHGENWEQIQRLLPGRSLDRIRYYCRHPPKIQIRGNVTQ